MLATGQDDLQSDAFRHVHEVLVLRFRGAGSQLKDPTVALAAGTDARLVTVAELLVEGRADGFDPALAEHVAAGAAGDGAAQLAPTVWEVPEHVPDYLLEDGESER